MSYPPKDLAGQVTSRCKFTTVPDYFITLLYKPHVFITSREVSLCHPVTWKFIFISSQKCFLERCVFCAEGISRTSALPMQIYNTPEVFYHTTLYNPIFSPLLGWFHYATRWLGKFIFISSQKCFFGTICLLRPRNQPDKCPPDANLQQSWSILSRSHDLPLFFIYIIGF